MRVILAGFILYRRNSVSDCVACGEICFYMGSPLAYALSGACVFHRLRCTLAFSPLVLLRLVGGDTYVT